MRQRKQSGVTLVELMVGLVVTAILFGVAIPNFRNWVQSAQIRTGAEAIENGLQVALNSAVTSNSPVQFSLQGTGTTASWAIGCPPATACGLATPQSYSAVEGAPNATVTASQTTVVFNGLGRVMPAPAGPITFVVQNQNVGGACAPGGPMRCLTVRVSAGGDIRMCDPALTLSNPNDPQAC